MHLMHAHTCSYMQPMNMYTYICLIHIHTCTYTYAHTYTLHMCRLTHVPSTQSTHIHAHTFTLYTCAHATSRH
jgi:hypothetical protein